MENFLKDTSFFIRNSREQAQYNQIKSLIINIMSINENIDKDCLDMYIETSSRVVYGIEAALKEKNIKYNRNSFLENMSRIDNIYFGKTSKKNWKGETGLVEDETKMEIILSKDLLNGFNNPYNREFYNTLVHELCHALTYKLNETTNKLEMKESNIICTEFVEDINVYFQNYIMKNYITDNFHGFGTLAYIENDDESKVTYCHNGDSYPRSNIYVEMLATMYEKELCDFVVNKDNTFIDKLKSIDFDGKNSVFDVINSTLNNIGRTQDINSKHNMPKDIGTENILYLNKAITKVFENYVKENNLDNSSDEYLKLSNGLISMSPVINGVNIFEESLKSIKSVSFKEIFERESQVPTKTNDFKFLETSNNIINSYKLDLIENKTDKLNLEELSKEEKRIVNITKELSKDFINLENENFNYLKAYKRDKNHPLLKCLAYEQDEKKIKEVFDFSRLWVFNKFKLETFLTTKDDFGISILDEAKRVDNQVFSDIVKKYKVKDIENLKEIKIKDNEIVKVNDKDNNDLSK